jgi:hypothetical protein
MAYDKLAVVSIQGTEGERFIIVLLDSTFPKVNFMQSSNPLPESELRAELENRGLENHEIESRIRRARENR